MIGLAAASAIHAIIGKTADAPNNELFHNSFWYHADDGVSELNIRLDDGQFGERDELLKGVWINEAWRAVGTFMLFCKSHVEAW